MSKKEIKGLDEEELVDLLFEDYEEEDLEEIYEDLQSEEDDEEEGDDEE